MDPGPKRQSKRDSAKKNRERAIYTQKAVRAKEALFEKKTSPQQASIKAGLQE